MKSTSRYSLNGLYGAGVHEMQQPRPQPGFAADGDLRQKLILR
jgi:hypothetical protein